jgi:carbonic anhydrase
LAAEALEGKEMQPGPAPEAGSEEGEFSRRGLLGGAGAVAGAVALGLPASGDAKKPTLPHPETPPEALRQLLKGNRRYRKGRLRLRDYSPVGEGRASTQQPFAAIITCADSRISPTLIFDLERGNIFASKIAGNGIDVATLGSTEYAVKVLGVKLVMVLGHSDCGAIKAAIAVANGTAGYPPEQYGAIGEVIDALVPPIQEIPPAERTLDASVVVNARAQAGDIASRGPIIKPAIDAGALAVVAAVYNIADGKVSLV